MGPQTYHYVKFFARRVGYIPLGTPCNYIMVVIDQSNTAMPFISIPYLVLGTVPTNQCHNAANCQF